MTHKNSQARVVSAEQGVLGTSLNARPWTWRYLGAEFAALNGEKMIKNCFSSDCCFGGNLSVAEELSGESKKGSVVIREGNHSSRFYLLV